MVIYVEGKMKTDMLLLHLRLPRLEKLELFYRPVDEPMQVSESKINAEAYQPAEAVIPQESKGIPSSSLLGAANNDILPSLLNVLISFPLSSYLSSNLFATMDLLALTPFRCLKLYCFRFSADPALDEEVAKALRGSLQRLMPEYLLLDMAGCLEAFYNYVIFMDFRKLQELKIVYVESYPGNNVPQKHAIEVQAPHLSKLAIDGLPIRKIFDLVKMLKSNAVRQLFLTLPYSEVDTKTTVHSLALTESSGWPAYTLEPFNSVEFLRCDFPPESLRDLRQLWRLAPKVLSFQLHLYAGDYSAYDLVPEMVPGLESNDQVVPLPQIHTIEISFYENSDLAAGFLVTQKRVLELFQRRYNHGSKKVAINEWHVEAGLRSRKIRVVLSITVGKSTKTSKVGMKRPVYQAGTDV